MASAVYRTVLISGMCLALLLMIEAGGRTEAKADGSTDHPAAVDAASNTNPDQTRKVEWFKEELRITPKYVEDHQGVFGLSWAHFLTMVFLVVFFLSGLVSLLVRYRRTQELLRELLKEGEKSES